jgi:hypothetical protein
MIARTFSHFVGTEAPKPLTFSCRKCNKAGELTVPKVCQNAMFFEPLGLALSNGWSCWSRGGCAQGRRADQAALRPDMSTSYFSFEQDRSGFTDKISCDRVRLTWYLCERDCAGRFPYRFKCAIGRRLTAWTGIPSAHAYAANWESGRTSGCRGLPGLKYRQLGDGACAGSGRRPPCQRLKSKTSAVPTVSLDVLICEPVSLRLRSDPYVAIDEIPPRLERLAVNLHESSLFQLAFDR